jgi:hypothetical protein
MIRRLLFLAALALAAPLQLAAEDETFEQMQAKTDMSNVDQLLTLAQWCKDHDRPSHAKDYWKKVIQLDPDNETAHEGLGQVKVDDKWVTESTRPQVVQVSDDPKRPAAHGNAPTADEITWDMAIPKDPQPENDFINAYIDKLPTIANDSNEMDSAVATMLTDENLPMALPRLCKALDKPDFNDLYGAANVVMGLAKVNRLATARPLLAHLVKATEHCSDPDDVAAAIFAIALFKDRRAIPRIIELYDFKADKGDVVKQACSDAVAAIAAMPPPVSKAQAQAWWERNFALDPHEVYLGQLRNPDPKTEIGAAEALFELREKAIFPVLVKLLTADDRDVNNRAIRLIAKMSGLDFNYSEATTPDERAKRAAVADKWWKDNGAQFRFPEPPPEAGAVDAAAGQPASVADQAATWVTQLGSIAGHADSDAERDLKAGGKASVPALIAGLENSAAIIRDRCNEILKAITKQDYGFDAHGSEDARTKAIAAWKSWADANLPPPPDAPEK